MVRSFILAGAAVLALGGCSALGVGGSDKQASAERKSARSQSAESGSADKPARQQTASAAKLQPLPGGGVRQEGMASYFRAGERGNTVTASGAPVDPQGMTAAHRTLPFGTVVTVASPKTGKSVDVTVTDRGPTRADRVIDISEAAATQLGIETLGVAEVEITADPAKQKDDAARQALGELATREG